MGMLAKRVEVLTEYLQENAGKDSLQDRYHTGYIAAANDILRLEYQEVRE